MTGGSHDLGRDVHEGDVAFLGLVCLREEEGEGRVEHLLFVGIDREEADGAALGHAPRLEPENERNPAACVLLGHAEVRRRRHEGELGAAVLLEPPKVERLVPDPAEQRRRRVEAALPRRHRTQLLDAVGGVKHRHGKRVRLGAGAQRAVVLREGAGGVKSQARDLDRRQPCRHSLRRLDKVIQPLPIVIAVVLVKAKRPAVVPALGRVRHHVIRDLVGAGRAVYHIVEVGVVLRGSVSVKLFLH
mmetsp:Transcript_30323/g.61047  ORF Transcript_30323/g.61047 Transcript_30323/m.61047 type:complete len:245 (+) Transcript_30323:148-882(+)